MDHASSAYTLDLYAGYAPSTSVGIGSRYMGFLRASSGALQRPRRPRPGHMGISSNYSETEGR